MKNLFVCTGNSCRSFMAEYYARSCSGFLGLTDLEFSSAGTGAWEGALPSPEAEQMLAGDGIDGSAHRARLLSPKILADTDICLCMTLCHLDAVKEMWGENAAGRVMLLGEVESPGMKIMPDGRINGLGLALAQRRDLEVIDPMGRDAEFYLYTYKRIKGFVDKLLTMIMSG